MSICCALNPRGLNKYCEREPDATFTNDDGSIVLNMKFIPPDIVGGG